MSKINIKVRSVKARNALAVVAYQRSGAGVHGRDKYSRKIKHKKEVEWK